MLARDRVRFVGEPVAVVVARRVRIAEDAAELIDVEYEPLAGRRRPEAALAPGAPRPARGARRQQLRAHRVATGRRRRRRRSPPPRTSFRKRFHFGRCHAAPLEARGVIADWDVAEGR